MIESLLIAVASTLAVLLALVVIVAITQLFARWRWRRAARGNRRRPPRWHGHADAMQMAALWGRRPPRLINWFWRGMYPVTLRPRPDGLLITPRGRVFARLCGRSHTVLSWSDLTRAQQRRLGRVSTELGPSVVTLWRVSLLVTGRPAAIIRRRPVAEPVRLRVVTPAPAGLVRLIEPQPVMSEHPGLRPRPMERR